MIRTLAAALAASAFLAGPAAAQPKDTGEAAFRALYKELVETNTTASAGNCTTASAQIAARLKAGGIPEQDIHLLTPADHPRAGNIVVVYPGRDPKAKAVLGLAHIDVVEAKREDWTRDPFKLVEEDGYFYARGASDDKAQAAIYADMLIRFRREGYKPRRTVKVMLTCGEEGGQFNGARWLTETRRDLIDAGVALNEGAGGALTPNGERISHNILVAEKTPAGFTLEVTNPGGHSSRPVPDNAIYRLARALDRLSRHEFPAQINDTNRGFFARMSKVVGGETGQAMAAIAANPADAQADAILSRDPSYRAMLRTTCVATMLEAGHAPNALPQRARATINCRVFPGESAEAVRAAIVKAVDDPQVSVSTPAGRGDRAAAPPLTPQVLKPIETITTAMWPGIPVVPMLQPAATDAIFLNGAGIPTFGISGIFYDPDQGHIHGLNERIRVKSVMEGREFLYRLVKTYADQKD
jgi:acetylornithine deacetylase/succinyl-diaminopimelate desuccinylase-like protein